MYTECTGGGERLRGGVDVGVDHCWVLYTTINSASPDTDNVLLRGCILQIVSGYERQLHDLVVRKLVIGKSIQMKSSKLVFEMLQQIPEFLCLDLCKLPSMKVLSNVKIIYCCCAMQDLLIHVHSNTGSVLPNDGHTIH